MESDEEVRTLLTEIRDTQREHLAEYRRIAERALAVQEQAVARQEEYTRFYRRISGVALAAIVVVVAYLGYLILR